MKKLKKQNGITLIALVITIIVMLILVSVTISMAINGNLFNYAGQGAKKTEQAKQEEQELSSGKIEIDGVLYDSLEDAATSMIPQGPMKEYEESNFSNGYLTENATYKSGEYTAVIPKGFKISDVSEENAIDTGLVIKDAEGNEFVWIPVTTKELETTFTYSGGYSEPTLISEYDTEKGYTQEGFEKEYKAMVDSVNENKGFYIGRYEATIDDNNKVGTKYGTSILISNEWYSLYENAKKANVPYNGKNVQTAMIYGVLWDETMAYITAKDSNYDVNEAYSYGTFEGYSTNITKNAGTFNQADSALNIWGLGTSRTEWTQEAYISETYKARVPRGGGNFNYSDTVYSKGPAGPRFVKYWGYGDQSYYCPTGTYCDDGYIDSDGSYYLSTRIIMYVL